MRKRKGEGIFGEVGRGEWVGRGGAGGRPIWGGRFGWGTRGFLFVIGCGDFLFLIMVSVWVWLFGFWTLPCARVVCGFHSRRWFFRGRSLQIYPCYLYVSSSPLVNPTVYVMLSVLYIS